MVIVQYPMQFGGPPRSISNLCSAPLSGSGSATTGVAFHPLLLPSKYYKLMPIVQFL